MPYKDKEKERENYKKYYRENKEKIKENVKQYQAENKNEIQEKRKEYFVQRNLIHKEKMKSDAVYRAEVRNRNKKYDRTDKRKSQALMRNFGINIDQYNQLKESQANCCAICDTHYSNLKQALNVDHCHVTGRIRGLLCASCNMALGLLKDDFNLLNKSIQYLQKETPPIKMEFPEYFI